MTDQEIRRLYPQATIRRPPNGPVFLERVKGDGRPVSLSSLLGLPPGDHGVPRFRPLSEDTVRSIRDAFWSWGDSLREISSRHSVSLRTTFLIVHNLRYWWVS